MEIQFSVDMAESVDTLVLRSADRCHNVPWHERATPVPEMESPSLALRSGLSSLWLHRV
jgi:hypothetical protein